MAAAVSETVGVVVATFGSRSLWQPQAERAVESIRAQTSTVDDWIWVHGETLHEARNRGADLLDTDWLIFLDADDELDAGYVAAMRAGDGDIRRPATRGVYADGSEDAEAVLIPKRDLRTSNYIVIGAMCRSSLFFEVGGFDDYPILEDWGCWRKMVAAGAVVGDVPDAVYRVGVRSDSRNTDTQLHTFVYKRIRQEIPL